MIQASRLAQLKSVCCRFIFLTVIFFMVILLGVPYASGQSTGGRIRGTVTDASGSAVVGATVVLVNTATNIQREVTSNATGEYLFLEVPVGKYEIDVNQTGFKKFVRKDIVVDLNSVVSVDLLLQIGGTTETVEVTGAPPVVDTSSTQLGAIVGERASTQLPLNQRDAYQLLQLQPGVQSQIGNDLFYGSDKAGVVTVNGGRGRSNNFSVNGGDGNDLFANTPAIQPSPDSIEEFRVITNSFDAEYGRNSGAVVNVVTKSGTNNYHGSGFEFFRNKDLNAGSFGSPIKPDSIQNQFGMTLGGPIKRDRTFFFASYEGARIKKGIPSISQVTVPSTGEITKGDFTAVDSNILSQQPGLDPTQPVSATNPAAFQGYINDVTVANVLNNRCGPAIQSVNPTGGAALNAFATGASTNPVSYASIFPNLQIPTSCFDPVSVSLLKYFQPANIGLNGRNVVPDSFDNSNQFQLRFDHTINNNQKLSVYYYFNNDSSVDPFSKFQAAGANLGNFPGVTATRVQQINASHTWTIGSTAVNELRFSYFREGQGKFNTPKVNNLVTDSCAGGPGAPVCFNGTSDTSLVDSSLNPLGTTPICPGNNGCGIHPNLGASKEGVPFVQIAGGVSVGNNYEGQLPQVGNTFQISDNWSKIIGNHSLKFGADYRYQKFDQLLYYNVNGWFSFQSSTTPSSAPGNGATGNDVGFADPYATFLLGLPYNYSQGSAQHEYIRSNSIYLFAQDSWKIKPSLTLNYGLRWELNTPMTDIGHRVQTFRPNQNTAKYPCEISPASPLYAQYGPQVDPNGCADAGVLPTGLVFPGDKGVPNGLTNTYYKGFAPRIGLNWSPNWTNGFLSKLTGGPSRTSISMGYGIFYNPIEQLVLEQFSAEPPFGISNNIVNPLFQTPYVDQTGSTYPNVANGILPTKPGDTVDWSLFRPILLYGQFPQNLRMQYSDQYNLTIKRQLPGDILLQVGYVGSQGHRLLASYQLNTSARTALACNELNTILGPGTCGPFYEDSSFTVPAGTVIPQGGFDLPYGPNGPQTLPAGFVVGSNSGGAPITLVGLRPYSSPNCNPFTGAGCPVDGKPVFSGIFSEATVANSNYNSLQAMVQKNFAKGLQFQASYTWSKSLDNASSFENAVNPLNFRATYGPSLYDARQRFVLNYVWDLPVPKMEGFKGKLLNGWQASGIATFQTGFPVRITSTADIEQLDSTILFENVGEPNLAGAFKTWSIRQHGGYVFDPSQFTNATVAPGTIGNSPRSLCCGPGLNNWDMGFFKGFGLTEKVHMEFRTEIYNVWNHAQFYGVDGNISDGSQFGRYLHVHEPREIQFGLKLMF